MFRSITERSIVSKTRWRSPAYSFPAFPGTNCEYDTARAFERAGADVHVLVFKQPDCRQYPRSIVKIVEEPSIRLRS